MVGTFLFFIYLFFSGDTAKDTWERLRRCFMNAVNRRRVVKNVEPKIMPPWKYESEMGFLLDMIGARKATKRGCSYYHQSDMSPEKLETSEPEVDICEVSGIEVKREELLNLENETYTTDYHNAIQEQEKNNAFQMHLSKKEHTSQEVNIAMREMRLDETDMFFLSMAKMTKRLPSVDQAKIKLQLSQSVLNAQIAMEEHKGQTFYSP